MVFVLFLFISSDPSYLFFLHDRFHSIPIDRNDIVHIWTLGHFITKESYIHFFSFSYTGTETHTHTHILMETKEERKKIDRNIIFSTFRFTCAGKQKCWTRQQTVSRFEILILTINHNAPKKPSIRFVVYVFLSYVCVCVCDQVDRSIIMVGFCLEEFYLRFEFIFRVFLKVFISKMKSAHWICVSCVSVLIFFFLKLWSRLSLLCIL